MVREHTDDVRLLGDLGSPLFDALPASVHLLAKLSRFPLDVGAWRDDSWAEIIGPSTSIRLSAGGGRAEHIATLMASSAELSTLSRNIHRLTALLRQTNVEPARPYGEMLETLAGGVRRQLELAARAWPTCSHAAEALRPALSQP